MHHLRGYGARQPRFLPEAGDIACALIVSQAREARYLLPQEQIGNTRDLREAVIIGIGHRSEND